MAVCGSPLGGSRGGGCVGFAGRRASLDREQFGGDVLAGAAPGEGAHVALPAQLDVLAGAAHEGVGQLAVGDGEFELVAAQAVAGVAAGFEAALDHLALVGLEDDALPLEVVDVARVDAGAVDEEETEIDEGGERQNDDGDEDGDDFGFTCDGHDGCFFCVCDVIWGAKLQICFYPA